MTTTDRNATPATRDVPQKPRAFVLAGAFRVVCRNPRFVTALAERGLAVLVMTPSGTRDQVTAALQTGEPVFEQITEVRYVAGSLDRESSFNASALALAAEWRERFTIVGTYAMEETLVEPAGLIGDQLALPSPGLRASRVCRSKYLQRYYLAEHSPWSLTLPPEERDRADLATLPYPVVAKPAGRHASSGVLSCRDQEELASALSSYPAHETVLVEQQVQGPEYSVESLVQNGRPVLSSVTAKRTTEASGRGFVELAHTVPAPEAEIGGRDVAATLREADAEVLRALGQQNGITHSEWRVTASGEPYLMEIASRTPGDGITLLYGLAFGAQLESEIVRVALGETAAYPEATRFARQVYLEHPAGVLEDVVVDWPGTEPAWVRGSDAWPVLRPGAAEDPPALRGVLVLQEKGSRLGPLRSSDDRAVTFFIDAGSVAELDELERRVTDAVRIVVTDDEDAARAR
ncbi:ATP-grasp domain-containing protein [Myceligenerans xiligouense]|uniref:ATP-grasp domain-containing protein n=1 Tax=Myceligenerans xiligouense TaxID=253184 RepID=A0A3N4YQH9_9MICO|nr:ATP-grasp domain-containing protein [Myceligenerans xiligouense]RPF20740.1 ATP-grasp domain-containing protein [Myceligenerans xiligouense]